MADTTVKSKYLSETSIDMSLLQDTGFWIFFYNCLPIKIHHGEGALK